MKAHRLSSGFWRSSMRSLLLAILLLVVGISVFENPRYGPLIQAILFTLMYTTSILAVGAERSNLTKGLLLLTPLLLAKWSHTIWPQVVPHWVTPIFTFFLLSYVTSNIFIFIIKAPRVNSEVIYASISTYLLFGILWAIAYEMIDEIRPGSFSLPSGQSKFDIQSAFYFSFITMATVGYGDIYPRLPIARTLTFLQAVCAMFYMAILVARMVSQYSTEKKLISDDK